MSLFHTPYRGRFSYLPADRQKYISARALGSNYDRDRLLRIFAENARTAEQNNPHWAVDNPMAILFIKSDLRLVIDLQTCVKAQQSRAYAQKVKISNLQQMARTVAYVQEHGYDSRENLSETADAIYQRHCDFQSAIPSECGSHVLHYSSFSRPPFSGLNFTFSFIPFQLNGLF